MTQVNNKSPASTRGPSPVKPKPSFSNIGINISLPSKKKILEFITASVAKHLSADPNKSIKINLNHVTRGKTGNARSLTDLTKQLSQEVKGFSGDDMDLEEEFYSAMVAPKDIENVSKLSNKNEYGDYVQDLKEIAEEDYNCTTWQQGSIDKGFTHFYPTGRDTNDITQRVYINAKADDAPYVLEQILHKLEDLPGVIGVKIAGPDEAANRIDNIVVYCNDKGQQEFLDFMKEYQSEKSGEFNDGELPDLSMLNKEDELIGVYTGAEPEDGKSFNQVRSEAMVTISKRIAKYDGLSAKKKEIVKSKLKDTGKYDDSETITDTQVHSQIITSTLSQAGIDPKEWSKNR